MTEDPPPSNGVRFTLELARGGADGRYEYRGAARIAERDIALKVDVVVDGESISVFAAALPDSGEREKKLEKVALAFVRTAVRSAIVRGQSMPRRVQRCREG